MKKILFFAMTLVAGVLVFSSCNSDKNDPDMSNPVESISINPEDWHAVPQSGCTIKLDDISLTVPANTFSEDTKLSVTPLKKGSSYAEYEASNFYYITVPSEVNRSITVKLTPSEKGAKVQYAARAPFHRKSTNETIVGDIELECSYDNDECTIMLPTSENGSGNADLWIIVGLVKDDSSKGSAIRKMTDLTVTPAGQVRNVKWHYAMDTWLWLKKSDSETVKINNLMDKLTPIVEDALTKIHDLGFALDEERNIPICFIRDEKNKESYGFFCQGFWSDKTSTVELNLSTLEKSDDPNVWGRTCIHEILHYFQANYDKRIPEKKYFGGEEDILNEATAVWVEQFMNDGKLDAYFVGTHINPFLRGFQISENGNKASNQGYAMSSMLYYLTSPISGMDIYGINKNSIVELFQIWKNNSSYRGTSYATLYKWFADHSCPFMSIYYKDFLLSLLSGKLIDLKEMGKDLAGLDDRLNRTTFNTDRTYTYPKRTCLSNGCALDAGNVHLRESFAGKEITITQNKPDVETYLVVAGDNDKYDYYKQPATLDNPLVIKGEEIDKMLSSAHKTDFYFVTINQFSSKKDFEVSCTIKDEEAKPAVPNITAVTIEAEFVVGTEDTHGDYYILRTYDSPTVTKTATGYTVSASEVVNGYTQSLYAEVNTSGASPVVTQMTVHAHYSDYGELSATLTNMPCTTSSSFLQYFSAYEDQNTLHVSSFSYDGPYGTFNHMLNGYYPYAELRFYID